MSDLVERYVVQVGRYLPESEREEVQKELRSLIQDQLDDRYKGAPTEDDVAELLTEIGDPRQMAASYSKPKYLVGPELYPVMIWVLQRGWVWIPIIVVIVRAVLAFISAEPSTLLGLFLGTAAGIVQALFLFSAIVVMVFALIQHFEVNLEEMEELQTTFDPRELPPIENAAAVNRGEVALGIAFSAFFAAVLFYFLRVGGLTLRFNVTEPVDVIPVQPGWMIVYIVVLVAEILINLFVLRRDKWTIATVVANLVLDLVGVVALYFVVLQPMFDALLGMVPSLANIPLIENSPLVIAFILGVVTLIEAGGRLHKLVTGGTAQRPAGTPKPEAA